MPPTAPIVTFEPNTISDLIKGKVVFVNASNDDGKLDGQFRGRTRRAAADVIGRSLEIA